MRLFGLLLTAILFSGVSPAQTSSFDPLSYVDPFIGTGGHGHTFPGATVPFGMVQLSPDTRLTGWDGCSGYHYSDSLVYGFSHTHLSGTGVSDYGDILLMPATGPVQVHNGADGQPGYRSLFLKNKEEAGPGFYRTYLEDHQVDVKLTASERVGFHEYRFDSRENPHIVIDLEHRDAVLGAYIRQVSPTEIEGYRYSTAWARDQRVYFVARFSKPVRQFQVYDQDVVKEGTELQGKDVKAVCSFDLIPREKVSVKVAISAVSIDGARANLEAAIPGFEFESYHQSARLKWRQALSKIEVEDDDTDLLTSFYTALYHCMIAPNLFIDADGGYLGTDLKPHRLEGEGNHYTIFSLWDTYRATHPLYTIIEQQRTVDFIRTFLRQYEEGGQLPVWELAANYTGCMIGYHSVPVIVDAYRKGIGGYDANLALEAMKHSAEQDHLGLASYKKYGFILSNEEGEAVSKTLEYAYDDWCIAQMAQMMDRQEDYQHYIRRAQAYKNMYDPQTGFMRPRSQHQWVSPFDPREVNFHYTEANAWQYHFYVPHDMNWMIETHGGKEGLGQKLDALFTTTSETTGREQPDITGLIGQYAHGNEPSHHIAYLYNYVNQPWKTQNYLSKIVYDFYTPKPDGLIGNEDCGQMSAWLVFTSMGFYPVLPGSDEYVIGRPFFDRVTIHLENGNTFVIDAKGLKKDRPYVKSVQLNGKDHPKTFLSHFDIIKGGSLQFEMTDEADNGWGTQTGTEPRSAIKEVPIMGTPVMTKGQRNFFESTSVQFDCFGPKGTELKILMDGEPQPIAFTIDRSCTVLAQSYHPKYGESPVVEIAFQKIPEKRSIQILTEYAPQYAAGGDQGLIDFERGSTDFRTGSWQGYEGVNLEAIIDLGQVQKINEVALSCLQDENSWIFFPLEVQYWVSDDGLKFELAQTVLNAIPFTQKGSMIKEFSAKLKQSARYVKVVAVNRGVCPEEHKGAGGKAWVFGDEVIVR